MLSYSGQTKTIPIAASHSLLQRGEMNKPAFMQSPPLILQPKPTIGALDDIYEKEADDVADKVMRMPMPDPISFSSTKNIVSRKCAECEEEEKLHRKESNSDSTSFAPPIVHDVINSSGVKSLDAGTRSFMEPHFNYDFSNVKIHDNDLAAKSASSINALAYTSGNHVVFNSGQYNTSSDSGKRLLAHELTHVVQQGGGENSLSVQRWSYGTGTPPHSDYIEITDVQKPRVEQGMNLVARVVNNPKDYPGCHKFFKTHCVGGNATSLIDKFNAATLWFDTDNSVWGSGVDPDHVAFSDATFRMGRWFIGSTMIHEFMHRCGQDDEDINDKAIKKCTFRDVVIVKGKIVEK